jgi:putative transposase
MKGVRQWKWDLDEVYLKINGEMHYLWRAVDQDGEVLESYVTKAREKKEVGRSANNRVENSHLPFRRRERAMLRFRQMKGLQKFAAIYANGHNHFNLERHLIDRQTYEARRSAALVEWQSLMA